MTTVVIGRGIDASSLRGGSGCLVRELPSEAELESELSLQHPRLVVLAPTVGRPLEIAQRATRFDESVAIIIVAAPDRLLQLRSEMRFVPHLPSDLEFVSTSDAVQLESSVRKADDRTRARRRYTELVNAVKMDAPNWRPQPRQYLDNLLAHAPVGVILTDPGNRVLAWNPMAAQLSRVAASSIIGRSSTELRSHDGCEALFEFLAPASSEEAAEGRATLTLTFSDGNRRHIEATKFEVEGRADREGRLVLLLDVTERVLAEDESARALLRDREAEKLEELGLLAGGVAHDFNNILVTILGNAQIGLEEAAEYSAIKPLFTDIASAAHQASDLTQQMLAYSGRSKFEVRQVDLSGLVREVSSLLMTSTAKNARFRVHLTDTPLPVEIDVGQWRRVFLNLVTNASDAVGDRQGVITIESELEHLAEGRLAELTGEELAAGAYARIRVVDTGCGIDPDALARMFDPFFTTKTTGRGLGLSAVLGIVRSHSGELAVRSVVGEGTEFTIRIPLCEAVEPAPDSASKPARTAGGVILMVDDEPDVVVIAKKILNRSGYQVLTAGDGEAGLELIASHPEADMVLLDANMPGMNGRQVLDEMERRGLRTPVILSSGYDEGGAETSKKYPNLRAFLPKPYDIHQLAELVAEIIGE